MSQQTILTTLFSGFFSSLAATVVLATVLPSDLPAQGTPKKTARPAARIRPMGKPKAQGQDELRRRRAEKLAKPVFRKADWVLDYDAARARAKREGKDLLVYFTRSYAH